MTAIMLAAGGGSDTADLLRAVSTLAWPALAVLAVVLLRTPLGNALDRLTEVDVGSTKVLLQQQADNAANTAKAATPPTTPTAPPPQAIVNAAASATKDPAGAVLKAWAAVEEAIRPAARAAEGVISPTVADVLNSLVGKGVSESLVPAAVNLAGVRDAAAKKPRTINPAAATSFVAAATDIIAILKNAGL